MTEALWARNPRSRTRVIAVAATAALAMSLAVTPYTASAVPASPETASTKTTAAAASQLSDVRERSPKAKASTKKLTLTKTSRVRPHAAAAGTPAVGTTRTLLGLDDYNGTLYKKSYTLKAVAAHIEVWVADDTAFPAGDCRSAVANTTTVTTGQAKELATQFETNMFPKESQAFSVAPDRDGSGSTVSGVDSTGDGQKIMTLVDNVRDDNYYLGVNDAPTYIAGFFSGQFNELLDRNVMTIDAFDWQHRTTANPPDNPTSDLCTSRSARPYLYEGTFAHEYQHLLEYYQDANEVNWVNEGLSDFAESLTGYGDATRTVFQSNSQSHIYCYQGFGNVQTAYNANPRDCGGPENSLTLWGDQIDPNTILADYGNAWSFMLFLKDRYGLGFMSMLHRDGTAQGLAGLQRALDAFAPGTGVYDVIHDFQTATLVDGVVGKSGEVLGGSTKADVTSPSLNSTVNLGNPRSYAAPGAPANGADYVGLRGSSGLYLKGQDLRSLSFRGAKTLAPEPLKWSVVASPPKHSGNSALWSGNTVNLDAGAVTKVTVPMTNPTFTYSEYHLAEQGYDYAYTVLSTDGGRTYKTLSNANTVAGPLGPALNGDAAGWATQSFDLSAYKGKSVLVGVRYVSDGGTNDGGWYVDDLKVGGVTLNDGTTTAPLQSTTQALAVPVYSWNVRIIGVNTAKHKVRVIDVPNGTFSLTKDQIAKLYWFPRIVAVVAYDEPTEQYQPQALYTLNVNGVTQPGGGQGTAVAVRADRF